MGTDGHGINHGDNGSLGEAQGREGLITVSFPDVGHGAILSSITSVRLVGSVHFHGSGVETQLQSRSDLSLDWNSASVVSRLLVLTRV